MSDVDVAALRVYANEATPGPWFVELVGDFGDKRALICDVLREKYGRNALSFGEDRRTAEFVAAFDPPTALALLDRLEVAERLATSIRPCARCGDRRVVGVPGEMICCDSCAVTVAVGGDE